MNTTIPCSYRTLPHHLDPYGQVFRSPNPRLGLRFADAGGDGSGAGGDGGDGGDGSGDGGDGEGEKPLGAAGEQALERTKAKLKTAAAELKSYKELGVTADEIRALVEAKNAGNAPDADAIKAAATREAEEAASERYAAKARASAVREQAATLGFIDPKDALATLSVDDLADIDITDDEVDEAAVKKLLEDLAKKKPYLLKSKDNTADHRTAGIGSSGSGTPPESQPGVGRMRDAYAASSAGKTTK